MPGDPRKRRILGDRCAICPGCGFGRRYLTGVSDPDDYRCPDCGQPLVVACPACGAAVESLMQVECRVCGASLRAASLFGVPIRRKREPAPSPLGDPGEL